MDSKALTETSKEMIHGDILENLFSPCHTCPIRHQCSFHEERIKKTQETIKKEKETIYAKRDEKPNDLDWNKQLDKELRDFSRLQWKQFDEEVTGMDCHFEKKEIIGSLSRLQNEYDLRKWKVFELVRSHLRQVVLNFRAFKMSASEPMITWRYTEEGGKIPIINPILNYQLQSQAATERLIRTLDMIQKEDDAFEFAVTSGKRFWEDYLSKIPHAEVIDVKLEKEIEKYKNENPEEADDAEEEEPETK